LVGRKKTAGDFQERGGTPQMSLDILLMGKERVKRRY